MLDYFRRRFLAKFPHPEPTSSRPRGGAIESLERRSLMSAAGPSSGRAVIVEEANGVSYAYVKVQVPPTRPSA